MTAILRTKDELQALLGTAIAGAHRLLLQAEDAGAVQRGEPLLCQLCWPTQHKGEIFSFVATQAGQHVGTTVLTDTAKARVEGLGINSPGWLKWLQLQQFHVQAVFSVRLEITILHEAASQAGIVLPH